MYKIDEMIEVVLATGESIVFNPITYYEICRGLMAAGAGKKLQIFREVSQEYGILPIERRVWDKAAEIYADLKNSGMLIEDADIIIAAVCLTHDLSLVTNNEKHFRRVSGLKVVNWVKGQ